MVAAALVASTAIGARLSGRPRSVRDFFLAGRNLPWWAVSASIVATEISAVTYISVPSVVYRPGGNLTYLQLGLFGSLIARLIVGYALVPVYYRREIYSPYDFLGRRLGEPARRLSSGLFALGGLLAQASRVYLTAVVLQVILARELAWIEGATGVDPLTASVAAIGAVAVLWTWLGGIATVVWTDAVLFGLFLLGLAVSLLALSGTLDGGLSTAFRDGAAAGKFAFFDFDTDPTRAYTFWVALLAAPWSGVAAYGTDQLMAQRVLCCRSAAEARWAVIASIAAMAITFGVALVGIGLWAYYRAHPATGAALALIEEDPDRVFPVFIVQALPAGLRGLVLAGAFAAAISSLDSILAALAQTTLSTLYLPWRERRGPVDSAHALRVSRGLVLLWGIALCAGAAALEEVARAFASLLDLALAMASYTGGPLLAALALALWPSRQGGGRGASDSGAGELRDASGWLWSAPLAVLAVFALAWHQPAARLLVDVALATAALLWIALRGRGRPRRAALTTSGWMALLLALIWGLSRYAYVPLLAAPGQPAGYAVLAWPWWTLCGAAVAFVFGLLLRRPPGLACDAAEP
ncbi:MAG: hypothetical protein J4G09_09205 [Proteobacteria bacterium]|nr:hypothetical protein [Pseudomonadota bacterium]